MMQSESKNVKNVHENRKFSYGLRWDYVSKFINPETGLLFDKYVQNRCCPVCKSDNEKEIFYKWGGKYVKCDDCSMVYLNPVFKPEELNKYYIGLNTGQATITSNESDFYREIYTLGLNAIESKKSSGKMLDLGCSSGFFLDIAKAKGWETLGIEPGKEEAELARAKGHVIYNEELKDLDPDIKFDVITMWDVFEHIPDGIDYLDLFHSRLNPGGLIFMQIPNSDALAAKILQEKCNMFDGIEHCNLYNPKTINKIVAENGFDIINIKSVINEIGVMNNFLNYEHPYFGGNDYGSDLLGKLDEKFIHENFLGYKMQVVAQKK